MKYSTIPIILFAASLTISGQQINQPRNILMLNMTQKQGQ